MLYWHLFPWKCSKIWCCSCTEEHGQGQRAAVHVPWHRGEGFDELVLHKQVGNGSVAVPPQTLQPCVPNQHHPPLRHLPVQTPGTFLTFPPR